MNGPADPSTEFRGINVAKLISSGARLVAERPWSTLPGEKPHLDGRTLSASGARRRAMRGVIDDVNAANEAGNDVVIWCPPGSGEIRRSSGRGSFANLRWGFTVHVLDGRLIALQRVIFLDTSAHKLAVLPNLLLVTVPQFHVSSWNGMQASPAAQLFN